MAARAQGQLLDSTAVELASKGRSWRTPRWELPPSSFGMSPHRRPSPSGLCLSQLCQSCADLSLTPTHGLVSPLYLRPASSLWDLCAHLVTVTGPALLPLPLACTVLGRAVPACPAASSALALLSRHSIPPSEPGGVHDAAHAEHETGPALLSREGRQTLPRLQSLIYPRLLVSSVCGETLDPN